MWTLDIVLNNGVTVFQYLFKYISVFLNFIMLLMFKQDTQKTLKKYIPISIYLRQYNRVTITIKLTIESGEVS